MYQIWHLPSTTAPVQLQPAARSRPRSFTGYLDLSVSSVQTLSSCYFTPSINTSCVQIKLVQKKSLHICDLGSSLLDLVWFVHLTCMSYCDYIYLGTYISRCCKFDPACVGSYRTAHTGLASCWTLGRSVLLLFYWIVFGDGPRYQASSQKYSARHG